MKQRRPHSTRQRSNRKSNVITAHADAKVELHELEVYRTNHPEDHHDPNALELFCEMHPDEPECLVYDD